MPKIPYQTGNNDDNENEDYEIVSFEDFCNKSVGSKTDLLTQNDNINYRLCYESDKTSKFAEIEGETSIRCFERQTETSLSDPKDATHHRKTSGSFAPFGRYQGKTEKRSIFSGVIPKPRNDGDSSSREQHRYQRFSENRGFIGRAKDYLPGIGSGMLAVAVVLALCVAAWWAVCGALGGTWGEEHYRRLWERAHPDSIKKPLSPMPFEKILPENRYHDHNNLSTKNKNATDTKKKETNKKSLAELSLEQCVDLPDASRFDCYPNDASEEKCIKRGCCWKPAKSNKAPYCYYPPNYHVYQFTNSSENHNGIELYYTLVRTSGYPEEFKVAKIDFKYLSDDTLQIKIYNPEQKRFETPIPEIPTVPSAISNLKYRIQYNATSTGFQIIRKADNVTIVDTADIGAMILSDKFLQISTLLPTDHVFGFGEHYDSFMRDVNWRTMTIFNRDVPPQRDTNLYGSHPFYMAVEYSGNSHGMLLLNTNAMDVVLQPSPALTYRTVGGVLNLFVFLGPSPGEVVSQYTAVVGRPFMPPYWGLGFHLCRFGYNSANKTREIWKKNRDAGLPFDVQWNDIDYMLNRNDFTYDTVNFAKLPELVKEIHDAGMHYIAMFDPGVGGSEKPGTYPPYDRGLEMDIFVKNTSGLPSHVQVWNRGSTVFPDFTNPNTTTYWLEMMTNFHKKIPYDGAWIDMNEPSNFQDGDINGGCLPENSTYKLAWHNHELRYKTLCMDAKHYIGDHYDVHNIFSLAEAIATYFSLIEIRGKRPFIITRSSFPGLGHFSGHWTGDVRSSFYDMKMSISGVLNFNIFGVPLVGADICGFGGPTSEALCARWMQLGAFYPFSRNHNDDRSPDQDPASMGPLVLQKSIAALRLRYKLLPYYYTLFYRAHAYGETVARPLFFEWPNQPHIHSIDTQFLIGPHVMITPVLSENATQQYVTFPGPNKWYDLRTYAMFIGKYVNEDQIAFVVGGAILPLQEPPLTGPVTTTNSRSQPMQLLVVPDKDGKAKGELYSDDGDSLHTTEEKKYSLINFSLDSQALRSDIKWWGYGVPSVNNITILAQSRSIATVLLNGEKCIKPHCEFTYKKETKVLQIFNLNLSLDKPITVKWTYNKIGAYVPFRKVAMDNEKMPISVS